MRRETWRFFAACVAIVVLAASPSASAAKKKTPTPAAEASSASAAADKTEKVNLNTADEKAIAGAKGVGEKLAVELVKGRPYKTWDEVSKVKGVGSGKKLDALKKVLKLTEGVAPAAADKPAKAPAAEPATSKKSSAKAPAAVPEAPKVAAAPGPGVAGETASPEKAPAKKSEASAPKLAPGTKVNINTATKAELDALPEIGPVKAQAIVDYRNANGKFASPEDIMKVPGIKEGTFAKIKDSIVVR